MARWCCKTLAALLAGCLMAGCNTLSSQPRLLEAHIEPSVLRPGTTAVITVTVRDKHAIVDKVVGRANVDGAQMKLQLKDDGVSNPETSAVDAVAGDGIWSLRVDVDFLVAPGEFLLEFTAYREDGSAVPVRDAEGNVTPLTTTLPVIIYPPGE